MSRTSVLDGIDIATLQSKLSAMQLALLDLQSGKQIASASYSQGDGSKSVTYRADDIGELTQAILMVQTQIDSLQGIRRNRRAPMRPFF